MEHNNDIWKEAIYYSKPHKIHLLCVDSDSDEDVELDTAPTTNKRSRSPSLVDIQEELLQMKRMMTKSPIQSQCIPATYSQSQNTFVPKIFINQGIISNDTKYQAISNALDHTCLVRQPTNDKIIDHWVRQAGKMFIECPIQVNNYWFMVTQVDCFLRNGIQIDDCALITTDTKYPEFPTAEIVQKSNGKRARWNELIIYYGRLKILVVGAISLINTTICISWCKCRKASTKRHYHSRFNSTIYLR